jgi:hypothetical protein
MLTDDLKAKEEAMIKRFNKWLADHPHLGFSEAKATFRAALTEDDRDFLIGHFLVTDPDAIKIMNSSADELLAMRNEETADGF